MSLFIIANVQTQWIIGPINFRHVKKPIISIVSALLSSFPHTATAPSICRNRFETLQTATWYVASLIASAKITAEIIIP
jgi:hypothetical protein